MRLGEPATIGQVGGKGHSLSRLVGAGFAVPHARILPTAVYRRFVRDTGMDRSVVDAARPELAQGMLSFDAAAGRIREMFDSASLASDLFDGLRDTYADVAADVMPVAVRSSATTEDLPDFSFAGQQESYLNILDLEAFVAAVRRCWASAWSARALAYRHRLGVDNANVAVAVVVQRTVDADVSGVVFTANPATGARGEMIVNAGYGLGEGIVGGTVGPDEFVLDRESLAVRDTHLGDKALMVVGADDGGTRPVDVGAKQRRRASVSPDQLTELGREARAIEQHFDGIPQDIEWAFASGKLWILQSRPITNLPPEPLVDVRWDPPEPGAYLQRSQWVEHVPEPVSTLFEDLHMKRSLQEAWGRNLVRRGNHDYEDTQPPASFHLTTTVNGFAYRQVGEPPRRGRPLAGSPARRSRLAARLRTLRMYLTFVPRWRFVALPRYRREIHTWHAVDPKAATVEQLWTGIRAMSKADARYWYNDGVWNAFALSRGTEHQLHRFLEQHGDGQFTSGQFLSGLASPALDAQTKLAAVAEAIRDRETLFEAVIAVSPHRLREILDSHPDGGLARAALDGYFAEYGHQVFTLDFVEPSEAESPLNTLRSLHALLVSPYDGSAARRQIRRRQRDALRAASQHFRGKLRWRFRWRLWIARRYYPNRERAMFDLGRAWTVLRPLARELGRRLVEAGTLHQPGDIFFLTTGELGRAVRSLVALARLPQSHRHAHYPDGPGLPEYADVAFARRELREARKRLKPPALIPGPPPWSPLSSGAESNTSGSVLKGSAVSPGQVTGEACVILSPGDFDRMRPGTILVCPTTTPAWTQLFPQAIGLVTDIGGILAHGSIVAREYGIPAVLGLKDATERIRDGQTLTVDGDSGSVTVGAGLVPARATARVAPTEHPSSV
ncbi:MAG: PEP-utilizing enzyme [Gammaproteobacteria bacterium]|nr:PEP-utilizing enzyme [Gammaproteobacteria bacterium]